MQFPTRSIEQTVADLATKLLRLPSNHPNRHALTRMIEGLRAELRDRGAKAAHTQNEIGQAFVERRRFDRYRTLLGARMVSRGGIFANGCHIVGISVSGATVRSGDLLACPTKFDLIPRLGPSRHCEVVWRKGDVLGVRYIDG
jgi:hypothetical protein